MKTLVMKFGGSSVTTPQSFLQIAEVIVERSKEFSQVVVVISAMGDTTNKLIDLAKQVHPEPPTREHDMLISAGERISISLLAMALKRKGKDAKSFTGSQSGIITCARHSDARIIEVRPHRVIAALRENNIVIVAGFQGVGLNGEITTLGRGGSDTSAVALAVALKACTVEFYKDVTGIFSEDPKKNQSAQFFSTLDYTHAQKIIQKGSTVLHSRCIELAKKHGIVLHVLSHNEFFKNDQIAFLGTKISGKQEKESTTYESLKGEALWKEGACL